MENKNTFDCTNNMKDIEISESTKKLLFCHASILDIYENISRVISDVYNKDIDYFFKGFDESYLNFDREVLKIINFVMEDTMLNSNCKKM